jgi:NADPH:quinone reductase
MSGIRAVVVDPDAPNRLALADVEGPTPTPSEVVVRVAAVSFNRGEVRRAETSEPGFRPGWDLAGIVERAAADGSGPQEGSRVVGFLPSGAWTELACVPIDSVAALPEGVSFEEASTLPVAGLTALYALEEGGNLLGRSVLVTGASGGAGLFGLQLARPGRGWSGSCAERSTRALRRRPAPTKSWWTRAARRPENRDLTTWHSNRSAGRCSGTRSPCWRRAGHA